jgi:putative FmdB family regulatory protein
MSLKVFDYYCGECSETFELWIREETETPQCPQCGSCHVTKIFTKAPPRYKAASPYDRLDTFHDYLTEPIRSVVPKNYKSKK